MRELISVKNNFGQTLFEVVVAVSVAVLVITGILTAVALSLANAEFARRQAEATRYGQEAMEWLRLERDKGWSGFSGHANNLAWCLKTPSWGDHPLLPCGTDDVIADTSYWREVRFTYIDDNSYDVSVTVFWQDAKGRRHSSRLETRLTNTAK